MGQAEKNPTVSPASSREETDKIRSGLHTISPCRRAHWSTANTPFTSVAVVMTGTAPIKVAISPGQIVGSAQMAGEDGDDKLSSLVHHDHRRVGALVAPDEGQ